MTWLVPNWERSRGPAFILWKIMDWWRWNMTMKYYSAWLYKKVDWLRCDFVKWLTPWLSHARDFMQIVINENSTKLLDYSSMKFSIRTRDEHQYYFYGKCSIFGKVKIYRSQWKDDDGESHNLFVQAILGDRDLHAETKLLWEGRVLTKLQKINAVEEIFKFKEFCWTDMFVMFVLYGLKKLSRQWVFVKSKDCGTIYENEVPELIEKLLGVRKPLYELTEDDDVKVIEFLKGEIA
jgi:hypothetical protein